MSALLRHENNIPVSSTHHTGVIKLIAALLGNKEEAAVAQLWASCVGEEGEYTYGDVVVVDGLTLSSAASPDLKVPVVRYGKAALALQRLTPRTPVCASCKKLPITQEGAGFEVIMEGQCPNCDALLDNSNVETSHMDWTTGLKVPLTQVDSREWGGATPVPLTEEGIRRLVPTIHPDVEAAIKTEGVDLVSFLNALFNNWETAQPFQHPREALATVANPSARGLFRNDLRQIARKAKEGRPYQRGIAIGVGILHVEPPRVGGGMGKSRDKQFEDLLQGLFSADEMRRQFRDYGNSLPGLTASSTSVAEEIVNQAERRGHVNDSDFWRQILSDRPRKFEEIDSVAKLYGIRL